MPRLHATAPRRACTGDQVGVRGLRVRARSRPKSGPSAWAAAASRIRIRGWYDVTGLGDTAEERRRSGAGRAVAIIVACGPGPRWPP